MAVVELMACTLSLCVSLCVCLYVYLTTQELSPAAHRVVLSPHGLSGSAAGPEQLFTLLSFLKPGAYEEMRDVVPPHITDPEQQVRTECCGG
jgi:hypothetical protein